MDSQFKPGDRVTVRTNIATGHHRTPAFVQGKTGVIEILHGTFGNPDQGGSAEPRPINRIAVREVQSLFIV